MFDTDRKVVCDDCAKMGCLCSSSNEGKKNSCWKHNWISIKLKEGERETEKGKEAIIKRERKKKKRFWE